MARSTQPSAAPTAASPSWVRRAVQWCVRWRYGLGLAALLAVFVLSSIPNTQPPRVHGLDKAKHVAEYFAVALLFVNVATRGFVRVRPAPLLAAWAAVLLVALADETYQRWVPGRSFDWWDVIASGTGGLAAIVAIVLLRVVALTVHPARQRL